MTSLPTIVPGRLSTARAAAFVERARTASPTYGPVGLLLGPEPGRLDLEVERVVGHGDAAFGAAVAFLRRFGQQRAVASVWPTDAEATLGTSIVIGLALGPVTVVAVNRIVAVVDEPRRWGFAYGTLPGHVEVGEEAFVVSHRPDGAVVVTITARAHVALPAASLVQRLLVPIQRRYARRYLDAVHDAVRAGSTR